MVEELNLPESDLESYGILQLYYDGSPLLDKLSYKQQSHVKNVFNYVINKVITQRNNLSSTPENIENGLSLTVKDAILEALKLNTNMTKNWNEDSPHEHFWNYLTWIYEEYEGVNFEKQSLLAYQTEEDLIGGNMCLKDGLGSIIEKISEGLDVRLQHVVEAIQDYNSEKIKAVTNRGIFFAKRVVVSVPLGVLKSGMVKFYPELPENKQIAIKTLGMGLMNKIILKFPYFFWDKSVSRIYHISNIKGEIPWIDSCSTKEPVLLCWLACDYAEEIQNLTNEEILEKVLNILRRIFPNKIIPDPVGHEITKWGADPFSSGSWSVRLAGSKPEYNSYLFEYVGNLYFCGEATSKEYFGTVTGALVSGQKQAENIIKSFLK